MTFNNSTNNLFREQHVVNSAVNYVVLEDDVLINITNTATPRSVILPAPNISNIGRFFTVKDASGLAGTNNITVTAISGNIDGLSIYEIDLNNGSATFYSDGTNYFIDNKTGSATATTTSPLTAGGVMFSNGSQLTQDNANLFWNSTTNRLGINTNTPAGMLEVAGFITMENSSLALTTSFQEFTSLNRVGWYFVNCRHPNGDYFNFTCSVGSNPGTTFYLAVTGSADFGGSVVSNQGNFTNIDIINLTTSRGTIQSTGEQIEITMHNGSGEFRMRRLGAGPVSAINFQIIRLGNNF